MRAGDRKGTGRGWGPGESTLEIARVSSVSAGERERAAKGENREAASVL